MRTITVLAVALSAFVAGAPVHAASVILPAGVSPAAGFRLLADYGSYRLFDGDMAALPDKAWALADAHLLKFDRLRIDTRVPAIPLPAGFSQKSTTAPALHIVQFIGPIKDAWLDQLRATGTVPIQYIDSFGYLLWADAAARARLDAMAAEGHVLAFSQLLPGFIKLDHALFDRLQHVPAASERVPIIVQRYRHDGDAGRDRFSALDLKPLDDWTPQLAFEIARFEANNEQIRQLIDLPDVFWVGLYRAPSMNDEIQAQILAGQFNANQSGPSQPGYLPWLRGLGFSEDPDAYPILDITDSGVGDRTIESGDPTLHRLGDSANATRMAYNQKCTINDGDVDGHGHLNANIALGYDVRENASTPGARFPGEYQRGQGINPFGRLGATRVFAPGFDLTACGGSYDGVIKASYTAGARISSNSWGCAACSGQYDISSQAYDIGTRDADSTASGNQELITIFSAGNTGPGAGSIGSPGNGKNMLTVGAAENPRPVDEDGAWNDGCLIDGDGADNAMDVIFFSSRGPAPGDRIKPDLVAPGTHVTGTQAQPGTGGGICDAVRPLGNATYAASSGTSHAAPAVSGVASLSWWWIANAQGSLEFDSGSPSIPTPALMKAWLLAHPTWLTGADANDSLPSNAQGFGMPNLGDMFSDTPTWLVNQDHLLADSGQVWTAQVQRVDPTQPTRIVLAWTDAPGAVGTSPQVNNLDLAATVGSTQWHGNQFEGAWSAPHGSPDAHNNVEAIFLAPGSTEPLTIAVHAFNIAGDGVPGNADGTDQDFALVCSNCARQPTFAFRVAPPAWSVCTATTASVDFAITTQSILGFNAPATLSISGNPAGTTTSYSVNPVAVPGNATLHIGNLAAASAGEHALAFQAEAAGITRIRHAQLQLAASLPASPMPNLPLDNAGNVARQPLLHWTALAGAEEYRIEIARDATFSDVVYSATTAATTHTVAIELDYATHYYWRVRARNSCGEGLPGPAYAFTTTPVPGECAPGATPNVIRHSDFENGADGWTHSGDHDTWALSSARAHGPGHSMLAVDVAYDSDQRLVSPAIALPTDAAPLSLQFWNHQRIEDRLGGCYDGVFLEMSSDAGATWNQVPPSQLLVGAYRGPISGSFNNPARGKQAWCGDPQDWSRYVVDLDAHAGETVQFRFRMATDASTGRVPDGFYLDDVSVQGCTPPSELIFTNGFELP